LKISVVATKRRGAVSFDNLPRDFGRGVYVALSEEFYSTLTPGDLLRVNIFPSSDFNNNSSGVFGNLTYRFPFGSTGWYAEASIGNGLTRNIFKDVDQNSQTLFQRTLTSNVLVGYPIHRDAHSFIYSISEAGFTSLENSIEGMNDTKSEVLRQFLVYSNIHSDGSTLMAGVTLTGGRADKQVHADQVASDQRFHHFRFGAGYTTALSRVSAGLGLRLETAAQFTKSNLPRTEKYFLGDRARLRGYGYSEFIGDSGIAATAELGHFHHVGAKYLDSIAPFVFLDAGWIKQNTPIPGLAQEKTLASLGVGVQTRSRENFSVRAWVGIPLIEGQTTPAYSQTLWVQLTQAW
jgi:hemolysin activation/secretion protein